MKIIPPYKGEIDYPIPTEGQLLKIKLDPNGLHDVIDSLEFEHAGSDPDWLIRHRLGFLRAQNLANGLKDGFEPTFAIVQWKELQTAPAT